MRNAVGYVTIAGIWVERPAFYDVAGASRDRPRRGAVKALRTGTNPGAPGQAGKKGGIGANPSQSRALDATP